MGEPPWILEIELPGPDLEAALRLVARLNTLTSPRATVGGPATVTATYATEGAARRAMALVQTDRPDVRCSLRAGPAADGG